MEDKNTCFNKALSDFTFDVASGGAIRHFVDQGLTISQMQKELTYPTPRESIQAEVWRYLQEKRMILLREPGTDTEVKYDYVKVVDNYGRQSFKRVVKEEALRLIDNWKHSKVDTSRAFAAKLDKEVEQGIVYISCDMGVIRGRDPKKFEKMLSVLNGRERELLGDLLWERRHTWLLVTPRTASIFKTMQAQADYKGRMYCMDTEEIVEF